MNRTAIAVLAFVLVAGVLWALVISQSGDEHADEVAAAPTSEPVTPAPLPAAPPSPTAPAAQAPAAPAAPAAQPPATAAKAPAAAPEAPSEDDTPPSENRVPVPTNMGNVAELSARFEKEPRDSAASAEESKIQAAFRKDGMPAGLLASALCRQTVCRAEFRWTEARAEGYMGGMMGLSDEFDMTNLGVDDGTPDAEGNRTILVYFERKR